MYNHGSIKITKIAFFQQDGEPGEEAASDEPADDVDVEISEETMAT